MTDEYLMQCVKDEDLDKAAILYERYKKRLYNFFQYKNYNNPELSEDCVQQVFYRMIKYRQTYKTNSSFKSWLYVIARNVQQHEFKQQVKLEDVRAMYPADEVYMGLTDDHRAVHQALNLLPDEHREILLMSKFLGMKYDEIAEINGCTTGVIKTRVFRAIKNLREAYFKIT